ncbi:Orn/Lys/Arg decarboxylase N-terminal domain-containing protein [Paraburkholderia sacchari]|uniref:Orn/Lys/Arg family decarboxylase n=1 Tax=Paraburkholderia sacchari TaxID=159450 RepID=UPI001BCB8E57|nr:Orn/Lys/Arg decarboxylase N-terminal domain-containing protein [Paraburkholderia sacchari]
MIERTSKLPRYRVLIVDAMLTSPSSAGGHVVRDLVQEFESHSVEVVGASTMQDGEAVALADAHIDCVFVRWGTEQRAGQSDTTLGVTAIDLLRSIRSRNADVPIFLMDARSREHAPDLEAMSLANEFVWTLEDTSPFIAGRALVAMRRYKDNLLPPFTKALFDYTATREYSWAVPGHQGGVAFTKTPQGRAFFDFFGENLFRTDTGIERTPLGSLLDHEGPCGEAEKYAARVFGAHASYSVLNGTSGSNRTILSAIVADNQFVVCDRNCHKSIEQGLVISGGIPVFLVPMRNRYGIIGPIPPREFAAQSIAQKIETHPLASRAPARKPVYAVVTNCTYDGMCYDAAQVQDELARSVDVIHFDEAWYAYARFNPLYANRFGMRGDPREHGADQPTLFVTHSTHKLLAALSQASYIHVRSGRRPVVASRFNEAYMAQATTSPLYAIIAANEIGASMMDGPRGRALTQEVIDEAVDYRQALARVHREFSRKGEWFFSAWNPPEVTDPATGERIAFADAPKSLLANDPSCWVLHPGEKWHGFDGLPDGWCMLDPIKAGIVCPGMGEDGEFETSGIPAAVLSAYLYRFGIIPSRTTDFMVLCLFSVGITKGKWGTLVNTLLQFKRAYDANESLAQALPDLLERAPKRYAGMGLRDLANDMFAKMKSSAMDKAQAAAFSALPRAVLTPRQANAKLMAGNVDLLPLAQMAERTIAVGAIPYPPGIPILMPGESAGAADGPWLSYLHSLEYWNETFPGFEKVVEGAVVENGRYQFWCVKED